jgi:outer membrane immunogenic protein
VWGNSSLNNVIFDDGPPPAHSSGLLADVNALSSGQIHPSSGIGGVQAGYDLQVNQFVYGGVLDFSAMNLRGARDVAAVGANTFANIALHDDISADWLLTLRGRVGVAAGNFLVYATGGAAATNVKYNHSYTANTGSISTETDAVSRDVWGWAAGAGVDYALSNRVSLRGEYLHVGFGTVVNDGVRVNNSVAGPLNTVFGHNVSLDADIVRAGINLKLF